MDYPKIKWILCFCSIFMVCYSHKIQYIDMPVDHFSFATNSTFKLKYVLNDTYMMEGGPIFFYTGNEGNIETFIENTGFMFDIAPLFSALVVFAEHRYYGESLPYGNASFASPAHLGYLTSSQALADYVLLINKLQETYAKGNKVPVVAFGGSYGGMLAAWLRMKYPAVVVGAIAASAPIWQFQTPCENFNLVTTKVYNTAVQSGDCADPIRRIWGAIRTFANTSDGRNWLSSQWKLCNPLQNNNDINHLIDWTSEILVNLAMANYPYEANFLAPLPAFPVRTFCTELLSQNTSTDPKPLLSQFGAALEVYTNYTKNTKCNDINTTAPGLGEAAWDFQACTEIIMPQCSTDSDMFENQPWNFKKFSEDCFNMFKVRQPYEHFPVLEYGGKDIKAASNIVFSNGLLDPWSSGGVIINVSSTVTSVLIPEGAHHLDLRGEDKNDPMSVVEARNFHKKSIQKWIAGAAYEGQNIVVNLA